MECINESDEEEEDKFEINRLVSHPMPKLTTQRSYNNTNHPSVRTVGLPRAKTCDKPLQDFEKSKEQGLTTASSLAAMPMVKSSGNISEAARKRKVSVISNISNMDFTGSYFQLYLDVSILKLRFYAILMTIGDETNRFLFFFI